MSEPSLSTPSSAYDSALHRLLSLVDVERLVGAGAPAVKTDLTRITELARRLGNPQRSTPVIQVAGTKGKGSVSAMTASILRAHGKRVGLFTSPHLHTFRERIRVDGEPVSPESFVAAMDAVWPHAEAMAEDGLGWPSTFEVLTAMAFETFRREAVDVQVLEVGLGGRLDSTNVADADVAVITSISLDHTAVLGRTVEAIAAEKAGIIKPGARAVVAPLCEEAAVVVARAIEERGAYARHVASDVTWEVRGHDLTTQSLTFTLGGETIDADVALLGAHQQENAATALAAVRALDPAISVQAIAQGMRTVRWDGRFQVAGRHPFVVFDGAHNVDSIARLRQTVADYLPPGRLFVVFGCSSDKDLPGMAAEIAPAASIVITCASRHPRSADPHGAAVVFRRAGVAAEPRASVEQGLEAALVAAQTEDSVVVTGSLFVVAEALEAWYGQDAERYPEFNPHAAAVRVG